MNRDGLLLTNTDENGFKRKVAVHMEEHGVEEGAIVYLMFNPHENLIVEPDQDHVFTIVLEGPNVYMYLGDYIDTEDKILLFCADEVLLER